MYFISYKFVVGEVGCYCQVAVTFFWSHLTKPGNVVSQFILTPLSISLDSLVFHFANSQCKVMICNKALIHPKKNKNRS